MVLRACYYRGRLGANLGRNPQIGVGTRIVPHRRLLIGDDFIAGRNVYISADESLGIKVGRNAILAQGVFIRSANHGYFDLTRPINAQGHFARVVTDETGEDYSIVIGDDVWIGVNAIILSGAKIGRGCVIGAGAVVTAMEIPDDSIVVGNPAKIIGNRRERSLPRDAERFLSITAASADRAS